MLVLGSITYLIGVTSETISEIQRRRFKEDPKNEGKLYTRGLFSLARHINYGSWMIWRTSYALVSGGLLWGGFCAAFFGNFFVSNEIPTMSEYCEKKYSAQWEEYKKKTPYKMIPGVY